MSKRAIQELVGFIRLAQLQLPLHSTWTYKGQRYKIEGHAVDVKTQEPRVIYSTSSIVFCRHPQEFLEKMKRD